MKRNLIFSVVVAVVATFLFACKGGNSNNIVGKWKLANFENNMQVPEESKAQYEQMMAEMKKTSYFDFKNDGTYEINMAGTVSKGTWKVSDDGKKLTTKEDGKDKEDMMDISEMSGNKLVFEGSSGETKMKMTLEK